MSRARTLAAFAAMSFTVGVAPPAGAAPVTSGAAGLAAIADGAVVQVQSRRTRSGVANPAPPSGFQDTVGSIVYDSQGNAYNRRTGVRYNGCVFDEGYGRVRPCDAGGGTGG